MKHLTLEKTTEDWVGIKKTGTLTQSLTF